MRQPEMLLFLNVCVIVWFIVWIALYVHYRKAKTQPDPIRIDRQLRIVRIMFFWGLIGFATFILGWIYWGDPSIIRSFAR